MQLKTKSNFIKQQGFDPPAAPVCSAQFSGLLFQPRVVLICIVAGMVVQSPALFLALCALLWWSALLPRLNPFDAVYNLLIAGRGFRVMPAPAPRRTAQAMAGAFALACGLLIHFQERLAAYVIEGIFLVAVLALVFGAFCLGSVAYHLLRGRWKFVRQTLPWADTL